MQRVHLSSYTTSLKLLCFRQASHSRKFFAKYASNCSFLELFFCTFLNCCWFVRSVFIHTLGSVRVPTCSLICTLFPSCTRLIKSNGTKITSFVHLFQASLEEYFSQKWKSIHNLLTLIWFQTCMTSNFTHVKVIHTYISLCCIQVCDFVSWFVFQMYFTLLTESRVCRSVNTDGGILFPFLIY